jgi:phosphoglycerate dehydrogenase-like enzyme
VTRVLAQFGTARIAAALPDVQVLQAPLALPVPRELVGDVVFALGAPTESLSELLGRGAHWLQVGATGVDWLPAEVFEGRVVTCARGVSAAPIAEFVFAELLAAAKQLPDRWLTAVPPEIGSARLDTLVGKTLGVIGLGGVGTAVARRALAFEMRVLAVRATKRAPSLEGVSLAAGLDELLSQSDCIVVAAPATPRTHRLLDARAFSHVKHGAHVVNIARGTLIDTNALLEALDEGRVGWASLDVTDPEPLPGGHPLYLHPRAHITPHIAWSAPDTLDRIVDAFIANMRRYLVGVPLKDVVDPTELY